MTEAQAKGERANAKLAANLRQMIAVLQSERQALAGMDIDALLACTADKQDMCTALETEEVPNVNAECEGLLVSAKQLNEVNRRARNLLSVNVAARLNALTGTGGTYSAKQSSQMVPYTST